MGYSINMTDTILENALRIVKHLSNGGGILNAKIYPARSGSVNLIDRNIYHDVVRDDTLEQEGIDAYCYIELNAPLKVVRELNLWKEGEIVPIIAYLVYQSNFTLEKGAKIVVGEEEGYMQGTWDVNMVKMYGQGIPILWLATVTNKRRG